MRRKRGIKRKIPLINLWLISDRRLRAGYLHRYERGYQEGLGAGGAPMTRDESRGTKTARRARELDSAISGLAGEAATGERTPPPLA